MFKRLATFMPSGPPNPFAIIFLAEIGCYFMFLRALLALFVHEFALYLAFLDVVYFCIFES